MIKDLFLSLATSIALLLPAVAQGQCELPDRPPGTCRQLSAGAQREACIHYARAEILLRPTCRETADGVLELRAAYDLWPTWTVASGLIELHRAGRDILEELAVIERVLAAPPSDLPDAERTDLTSRRDALARRVGTVVVELEPGDAALTIDGRAVQARQPIRLLPGAHEIRATRAAHRPVRDRVMVHAARSETLSVRLVRGEDAAWLDVETDPAGADVFIDGARVGFSPRMGVALAMGGHTLRIELDRYDPVMRTFSLERGETAAMRIGMTLHRELYEEWWFWTLIALVVVGPPTAYGILYDLRIEAPVGTIGTVTL